MVNFALGVLVAFALVGMGFYWGLSGRSLVGLLTPWLGKLNVVWKQLPVLWGIVLPLLRKLKVVK